MNDIVLGMKFQVDGKDAVGTIKIARSELVGLREETQKATQGEAQARSAAEAYLSTLQKKAATLGLTAAEVRKYEIAQLKLTDAERQVASAQSQSIANYDTYGSKIEMLGTRMGQLAAGAIAAGAAMALVIRHEAIEAATNAEQSQLRLAGVLKATGYAAGLTSGQINEMVHSLSESTQFDDEGLRNAAAAILKFKGIQGDTFKETLKTAADMAAMFGTTIPEEAQKLARGMQDPESAMLLLRATGGNLNDTEKLHMQILMDSGHEEEARLMILHKVQAGMEEMAATMNTGFAKATNDSKKAWDELLKSIGKTEAVGGTFKTTMGEWTQILKDFKDQVDGTSNAFIADMDRWEKRLLAFGATAAQGFALVLAYNMKVLGYLSANEPKKQSTEVLTGPEGIWPDAVSNQQIEKNKTAAGARIEQMEEILAWSEKVGNAAEEQGVKEAEAYKKVTEAADAHLASMELQFDKLGATTEQTMMLDAATVALTLHTQKGRSEFLEIATMIAHAKQVQEDLTKAQKEADEAAKKYSESLDKELEAIEKEIEAQQKHNIELEFGKDAYANIQVAQLEALASMYEMLGVEDETTAKLQKRIAALRVLAGLQAKGESIEATQAAAKAGAEAWDRTNEHIKDSLYDAIRDGGKHGADALKKLFEDLVLRPMLEPYLNQAANALMSLLFGGRPGGAAGGAASGAAGAAGNGLGSMATGAIGNYLGSTALGGAATGAYGSYMAGYGTGQLTGQYVGMNLGGQGLSAEGIGTFMGSGGAALAGYVAAIAVALMANSSYQSRGFTTNNNQGLAQGMSIFGEVATDRLLQRLGMGSRGASNLTGSSGLMYLFGHGGTNMDASGITGSVGDNRFSGSVYQDESQQGGLFRRDRRWTVTDPMTAGESAPFDQAIRTIHDQMTRLGAGLGVDAGALLANFTAEFKIQIKDMSPDEINKAIADFLQKVFVDEAVTLLSASKGQVAEYMRSFIGTTEETAAKINDIAALLDIQKQLTDALAAIKDPLGAFKNQIAALDTAVNVSTEAFDAAIATKDPTQILAAEQTLQAAIIARYNTEQQLLTQLVDQLDQLKQQQFQFSLGLAQRYNAAGGQFDMYNGLGQRAGEIRSNLPADPGRRITAVNEYVSIMDTWYNTRKTEIMHDIDAQQAAANAAAAAQNAIRQARLSALQTELQLASQWTGILGQARQMLDQMRLTAANPLSTSGRLGLATEDTNNLFTKFQGATGAGKVDLASRLLPGLQERLRLLQENSQRPSAEYQKGYNEIIAMLSEVQGVAQTQDERALTLSQQIADAQAEGNVIAQDFSSAAQAQLDDLNRQYRDQLVWAEATGREAYQQQERNREEQINAITGGVEVDLYLAQLQTDSLAGILRIGDLLDLYLKGPPSAADKPNPTIEIPIHVYPKAGANASELGEAVVKVIEQRLPWIKRALQNA